VVDAARQLALKVHMEKSEANEAQQASDPELAAIFARDAEKALTRLKTIFANAFRRSDDIQQYVIDVHSMKSALANIGETELSATAFRLEQAGRAEDTTVMMAETPSFLESLGKAIERNKLKKDGVAAYEDSGNTRAYLSEKLLVIRTACEKYDEITANTALAELKQKEWPKPVKDLLDTIAMHLLHSDFEEAVKLAENFA
jgi:HPt (histidine-containing phosphotransfer) domain-containing protein